MHAIIAAGLYFQPYRTRKCRTPRMPWIFGNEGSGCMILSARDLKFGGVNGGSGMKGNYPKRPVEWEYTVAGSSDGVHKWKGLSSLGLSVQPAWNCRPIYD